MIPRINIIFVALVVYYYYFT